MVDFAYTETMTEIAGLARAILDDNVNPARLAEVDGFKHRFDDALWRKLIGSGVVAALLPEELGGDGLGALELAAVQIELGRALAPVPLLETVVAATAFGTAFEAGISTVATETELSTEGSALTGSASLVPYAAAAEQVLLLGTDTAWRVPVADTELTVQELVDGRSAARLEFSGLTGTRLDCAPGRIRDRLALGRCAHQLGVLERALELTAEYARTREQFGRPIGSFQAVSHRLADCYIDIEALRLTLWQAVTSGTAADLATVRYHAAEAGHRVAHAAVHVHGGAGLDMDNALHRFFLAAKRNEFTIGAARETLVELGGLLAR
ncbi:acyl-CoA dehydrogenase family protein [Sciscionella marina]|uniref:acyl-CoA dehydrogenase family protein n=1 Tax=Sciscionella marina TaxID=508770 RepID=UPI00036FCBD7|nr:acyl-CoA dehydrogenase family protein [Sciscionella marina]